MSFWPRLFGSKRKDRHNSGSIPAPRLPTPDPSDVSWDSPRKIDDPSWFTYGKARSRANFRNHDYHRELVDWEVEAYRRENPDQEEAIQLYKEAIEYQVARAGFFAGGVTLRNDAETHKAAMHGKNAITAHIDLALVYRVHKDFDLARSCANAALDIYDRYPMHVQEEPKMLTLRSEANLLLTEIEHYLGTVPAQKLEKKYLQILEISGNGWVGTQRRVA